MGVTHMKEVEGRDRMVKKDGMDWNGMEEGVGKEKEQEKRG